jgi:hypothetical protein
MNIKIVVLVVFHYVFLSETVFSGVLNEKNVEKLFIKALKIYIMTRKCIVMKSAREFLIY